ncbi:MAG: hypothetical protein A2Y56_06030 [Candidatus Aminicenantes bacterium RBG_13_63_10]|nr:MAG: hypothetical protein A2Y56_06030 [Candidatus Aminicenantes bacterium RBG_13_63_10]
MKCPQCQTDNLPDSRFCHKCATPLPQDTSNIISLTESFQAYIRELSRGTVFAGRYEVIEELGKGGMGRVYRVFDQKLQEVVALKLLNPEISFNSKAVDRFRNELRFARKISHRNVVKLYDLGEEGFTHYITMEHVDGENLKRFIKRSGQLTPAKAVHLALQVSEGLTEAHHLGVVHRDLKPQNIMIDPEGNARVLDFGIARFTDSEPLTASGVMIGTPEYMSPEQIDMKEVDARTDIYALGIILFEMLTGRVPFEGETPISIALQHKSRPPRNPRELNPQIDPALAGIILKCLEKDRGRRYQTAKDLTADLSRVLQGMPTTEVNAAKRASAGSREITVTFRLRKLLIPGLVVLVLGAAVAARFLFFKPAAPAKSHVVVRSESVPGPPPAPSRERSESGLWSRLSGEAKKYINPDELSKMKDAQYVMESLKKVVMSDPGLSQSLDRAIEKTKEVKKHEEEGRLDLAQQSRRESQTQMQELMRLVAQRQEVQSAKDDMHRAKALAEQASPSRKNLLFLVAHGEESSAEDAVLQNDFSGAKTLYGVLKKVYRLSQGCPNDQACLKALQGYTAGLVREVNSLDRRRIDPWTYDFAGEIIRQAEAFHGQKQLENAAASYIQAAFLYEKIKEQASPLTN